MAKRFMGLLAVVLVLVLMLAGCGPGAQGEQGEPAGEGEGILQIGISQIDEHPALDAASQGFMDGLIELGYEEGKDVEFIFKSAQGDIDSCRTIAEMFKENQVDLILAVATPNAQAAANVISDIPIVITAVTDPVVAGLAQSLERPGGNISGTTDMNPVEEQVALVKRFLPEAKTLGIMYNAGEDNSVVQVEIAREAASKVGLELVEATVTNKSEVNQAAMSLVGRVDAIYVPTDNTVAAAISTVVKVATPAGVPVFGSERAHVEQGGLATFGIDYYLLGKQTARVAHEIFQGRNPGEIPIEGSRDLKLIINKTAAAELNLTIPEELLAEADEILE
ncbi:MAG: ABC transporter substrate-binding protein [bacterium]